MTPELTPQEIEQIKKFIGKNVFYDRDSQYIMAEGGTANTLLELRGWGAITSQLYSDANEAATFQDKLGLWVADTIKSALTSERLKHKAEIRAYRDGLNKIIDLYPNTESKAIIALNDMRQTAFDTLNQFKQ